MFRPFSSAMGHAALFVVACWTGALRGDEAPQFAPSGLEFLKKHCVECHAGEKPEGSLSLAGMLDNASVLKARKNWLVMLRRIEAGEMPPEDRPRPAQEEIDELARLVRGLFDHHDRNAKPDPGRVTVRRLNRTEYNNTIRDLVGVDFNPAEDFPSDDIGHGFDNIGDVLTLPPVLMERYFAAAESIVERAITPAPPAPPQRRQASKYCEPAGADVGDVHFRPISTKTSDKPAQTGPLHTLYQVPADGEYIFRTRVYGEAAEGRPVKIAILAHGSAIPQPASDEQAAQLSGHSLAGLRPFVILKTVDVQATTADKAETIEVRLPANIGLARTAVALYKTPEDQPATLFVEYLGLEGPLDTRPASHRRLLACAADQPRDAQTREVIARFVRRAYRRPPTAAEVDRLVKLADTAIAASESWEVGVQRAFLAVLVSPKFLFRLELDDRPEAPEARPLDEFQLASRLSYFLWSTMPDEELLQLAEQGKLTASLESQVRRMLADPKAIALVENFALQWLQLQRLKTVSPDAKLFPQFNDQLRSAMLQETTLFMSEIIRDDRSILDLLDADFTYLNEPLARHYGIVDTQGNWQGQPAERPGGQPIRGEQLVRVSLGTKLRGGLPTQASVLTVTSNPTRTSPVKRGRWILEQILGDPPPPPPPNVPELVEGEKALTGSLRQRMEQHRVKASCANCHARMDPIGFVFENYDAVGAFRTKDGEFPVETAGELPDGAKFSGPEEFKLVLRDRKQQFSRCLLEKLLIYALGRGLEFYDRPVIDRMHSAVAAADYKFSGLVLQIVQSEPFCQRRGWEPSP